MKLSIKDVQVQYIFFGALFGSIFPIFSTLFDAYIHDVGFSLSALAEIQRTQPLHWVIDSAPFIIACFSWMAGIKQRGLMDVNEMLEKKVEQRTLTLNEQNEQLHVIQNKLEDSLERISKSINYAQRIQDAIISNTDDLKAAFPDSFVLYRPRDVVSGDFPWFTKKGKQYFIAAVDCTGHGVPGAFMSLIGYFLLNKVVNEMNIIDTGEILSELHKEVIQVLNQHVDSDVQDGMDMAICRVDTRTKEIQYSGAGNPVYHLSGNELTAYKADFWSIGGAQYKHRCRYRSHTFTYAEGDIIAMFSDGITDQFSQDGSTKFGFNRIQKHLTEHHTSPMSDVKISFEKEMDNWKGNHRQLDDMLFMGVRL